VVFQQWGKSTSAEQWCFNNGKSQKVLNSGVSAMKKEQRVADSGVSAMGKLVSS
jgi:hypothetical protein